MSFELLDSSIRERANHEPHSLGPYVSSRALPRQLTQGCRTGPPSSPSIRRVQRDALEGSRAAEGTRSWTWSRYSPSVLLGVVRSSPITLLAPLLLFSLCTALGIFGIIKASAQHMHVERGVAMELVTDAARTLELQLQQAFSPTITMEILVQKQPYFPELVKDYDFIAARLLAKVLPGTISSLQLAPGCVVQSIYPRKGNEAALGHDLLADPSRRYDSLIAIAYGNLTVAGPYELLQGGFGVVMRHPIFISGAESNETFGANTSRAECPAGICYNPVTTERFWGFVQGLARLDGLLQGSDARMQRLSGYGSWHLKRRLQNGTDVELASSHPVNTHGGSCSHISAPGGRSTEADCVSVDVLLPNAVWRLYLGKEGGWQPPWRAGLLALVVVGSFGVSALLFSLLVSRRRHRALLEAMFPKKALRPLQQGKNFSESFASVTVLFTDIVSYTTISEQMQPIEVAEMLNELYCTFDDICERNGCYKVETIGDAFVAVGGCPEAEAPEVAAERVAHMALDMVAATAAFQSSNGHRLRIRVGLASGPIAAAVIGRKMPRYCLFGDTVNLASRMEANSEPLRINIAAATAQLLRTCASAAAFCLVPRGQIDIKGKGAIECYWVEPAVALSPWEPSDYRSATASTTGATATTNVFGPSSLASGKDGAAAAVHTLTSMSTFPRMSALAARGTHSGSGSLVTAPTYTTLATTTLPATAGSILGGLNVCRDGAAMSTMSLELGWASSLLCHANASAADSEANAKPGPGYAGERILSGKQPAQQQQEGQQQVQQQDASAARSVAAPCVLACGSASPEPVAAKITTAGIYNPVGSGIRQGE